MVDIYGRVGDGLYRSGDAVCHGDAGRRDMFVVHVILCTSVRYPLDELHDEMQPWKSSSETATERCRRGVYLHLHSTRTHGVSICIEPTVQKEIIVSRECM